MEIESNIEYPITSNIPIPSQKGGAIAKYPIKLLQVGQSFFVPFDEFFLEKQSRQYDLRRHMFKHAGNNGIKVSTRVMTEKVGDKDMIGLRVWRIE